jgi:hypothetical protein
VQPFFELGPDPLISLLDSDKIYGIACDLLGPGPVLNGSEGNKYCGDTHWHGDIASGVCSAGVAVGFGRNVASAIKVPIILVNMV